jgi:hypothetical protein
MIMDRDKVIALTNEWLDLWQKCSEISKDFINGPWVENWQKEQFMDAQDVMGPVISLAYNRAREALAEYGRQRAEETAAHDRMLETIEQTLQENLKDAF